jgi:hypothetical protein
MKLNRIGPLSCAKMAGVLYAALGLIFGFFVSAAALFGVAIGAAAGDEPGMAVLGLLFGVGAVVVLPIVYGLAGFLSALVGAALYNLAARVTGGIELELE